MKLLTDFAPDPERLAVLAPCIDHYGVGDPKAEWPNNLPGAETTGCVLPRLFGQTVQT